MGVSSKTQPGEDEIQLYRQCKGQNEKGENCTEYNAWLRKKNWSRHAKANPQYHMKDIKATFGMRRTMCQLCQQTFAEGTRKRHERAQTHKANAQRQLEAEGRLPVSGGEEESGRDAEDEARTGVESLSVDDPRRNTERSPTPEVSIHEEVFAATKEALRQSIEAVEAYNAVPRPSTSEIKAATEVTRPLNRGKKAKLPPAPSRSALETPVYLGYLKSSDTVYPMTPKQYLARRDDEAAMKRAYIVCTPREARELLDEGTVNVPMLVRANKYGEGCAAYGDVNTIESFLSYLATKGTKVDIHLYDGPINDEMCLAPKPTKAERAIELFRDTKAGLVNFLNLGNVKDNPVPEFMVGLRALKILKEITEDNLIGKRSTTDWSDLSSCCAFHILAKAGVFSMPHLDHHGVITTATCDEGEKYWLTWPTLTDEEMVAWATDESEETQLAPAGKPFGIYLRKGDVLVQPRGRVHAPYSKTDVLMSGTMHWDSRDMLGVMRASLFERENNAVTNEYPAQQFTTKVMEIDQLWRTRNPAYPWASEEQYVEWAAALEEWLRLNDEDAQAARKAQRAPRGR